MVHFAAAATGSPMYHEWLPVITTDIFENGEINISKLGWSTFIYDLSYFLKH